MESGRETGTKLSIRNFWSIVVNSTATFVLAYLFVFYINHLLKVVLAAVFNYPTTFTYNKINYFIENYRWTHDSVILIFGAGPLLLFVLGILSLVIFASMADEEGRVKIIFIWFTLHAFNFVFSGLMIGNIFTHGVGHVFNWMRLHDTLKMIVALIGFFGLLLSAILVTKPIASSAVSYFNNLDEKNTPFFITSQVIVPYVIGSVIVLLYFMPLVSFQEEYSWIVLGILLLIVSGRINSMEPVHFDMEEKRVGVSWPVLIFTIIIVLGLRYLLTPERSLGL
jgi:hypothetical protein